MITKILTLFKLARKIAKSEAIKIISKTHEPTLLIKIIFNTLSFTFSKDTKKELNSGDEERLCNSIENMGTTFIKLGQFLSTRPDIIGKSLSKKLEKLQDRLPTFSTDIAKQTIKNEQMKKQTNN